MNDFKNGAAAFVMAHWRSDNNESRVFLDKAIKGIFNQSDKNWRIVIVDDGSPCKEAVAYLSSVKSLCPEKIEVILKSSSDGPGTCRNIGIDWAYKNNLPIVLFNDADDVSHPKRLETVRKIFCADPLAGVVYSTFKVIDENDRIVERKFLTQSILEILEGHENNPVEGMDAWIAIGTDKGYTNLTSSTAVKTEIAYQYKFPKERVSEDQHAWLRYSAGGAKYVYAKTIPSLYRIPQGKPTVSRARIDGYYELKAAVDTDGFLKAIQIADARNPIPQEKKDELCIKFYIKLAETLGREKQNELANKIVKKAFAISEQVAKEVLLSKGLQDEQWTKK